MELKREKYDVGVIVARFQVNELHKEHLNLLNTVVSLHSTVFVYLGVPPILASRHNPLTFEMRKQMVLSLYPKINVLPVYDNVDDVLWSKALDKSIVSLTTPSQKICLYGGRNSFKPHYSGKFPVLEFESEGFFSGTEIRHAISVRSTDSADFRAGVIWARHNDYPRTYATVDIAIMNEQKTRVLLGQKPGETRWRFVGGFSEPESDSFEMDAKREVAEETGVELSSLVYIGSKHIKDWRYRNEVDQVKTSFYLGTYMFGQAIAKDDISACEWFDFEDMAKMENPPIVDSHLHLWKMLVDFVKK